MQTRLADLLPRLNERDRRLALAAEAKSWGRGGITAVRDATGASRKTIQRGMAERNKGLPPDECIRYRIGINLGDIIVDRDGIAGSFVTCVAVRSVTADADCVCLWTGRRR